MFDGKFGEGTWAEFTKTSFEEQNLRQTVAKTFNDAMQNCIKVFQKLPQDVRDSVADHLRENHYYLAYKIIQVKFLRLGMGDTNAFAEAVRRIKLTPGKELSTHITEYNEAMKRWASVLYLSQLITGHAPTGEDNELWLLNLDVDEYIVQESIGDKNDQQLISDPKMKNIVLIPYQKRLTMFMGSLRGPETSKRFHTVLEVFGTIPPDTQSIWSLKKQLMNAENSPAGQDALANERLIYTGWDKTAKKINLKRPLEAEDAAAMVIAHPEGNKKQKPIYPRGSCKYHPTSTSHRTSECLQAQKKQQKELQSAYPHQQSTSNPPGVGKPKQNDASKQRILKHCEYCFSLGKATCNTHNEPECYFKKKAMNAVGGGDIRSTSSSSGITTKSGMVATPRAYSVAAPPLTLEEVAAQLAAAQAEIRRMRNLSSIGEDEDQG